MEFTKGFDAVPKTDPHDDAGPEQRGGEAGKTGPYRVRRTYPVTEVLGWWLREIVEEPEWVPVVGSLHEDSRFFGIEDLHLHADVRFLSTDQQRRAGRFLRVRRMFRPSSWHPGYQVVITQFALAGEERRFFTMRPDGTTVRRRDEKQSVERSESREWGLAQLRMRQVDKRCRRELPPAPTGSETAAGFHDLRRAYPEARGETCPHRGYDLRSVPIEADGCRQCPLHQLRVRAS